MGLGIDVFATQTKTLPMIGRLGLNILALQLSVHVVRGCLQLAVMAHYTLIYPLPVP
jgi:hypothetical protein